MKKKIMGIFGLLLSLCMVFSMVPVMAFAEGELSPIEGELKVPFEKIWDDNADELGLRPDSITVTLYKYQGTFDASTATSVASATVSDSNNWKCEFDISEEPLYNSSGSFKFKVVENEVADYEESAHKDPDVTFELFQGGGNWQTITPCSELNITRSGAGKSVIVVKKGNSYTVWTPDPLTPAERQVVANSAGISASSNFISGEGTDGKMTVDYETDTISFHSTSDWSTFKIGDYHKASKEANGSSITNKVVPPTIDVSVSKVWDDADDQDGKRPGSVTIRLFADEIDTGMTRAISEDTDWKCTFSDLLQYNGSTEIQYTVEEIPVEGYTPDITGDMTEGFVITNTHEPEKISVSGEKTWNDDDNNDGKRPDSITITVSDDEGVKGTKTVTAGDGWKWTFDGLPRFKKGSEINYTIAEDKVDGYETEIDGYNVINTHESSIIEVSASKEWIDDDNRDGIRPDSITVQLIANGKAVEGKTITLSEENQWAGTFEELKEFNLGVKVTYGVQELPIEGYTPKVAGSMEDGFVITNTHEPELITVTATKAWEDDENRDGIRPDSISVELLANGEECDSAEITAADGWKVSFENLYKFENGQEIEYTIVETTEVEGYTSEIDGFVITNTHEIEKTSVAVSKVWNDSDNADGIRPASVTVKLLANGEAVEGAVLTLDEANGWAGEFTDLPKFENGQEIAYTVEEAAVSGYEAEVIGNMIDGFIITNTHILVPKTGDNFSAGLWIMLMAMSLIGLAAVFTFKKKVYVK
ncbi:MAG: Cna B-type domain-containing protein [Clostridia bacterium]|nr:Cna B-type domain-containing protein [Clostridia bacterium]